MPDIIMDRYSAPEEEEEVIEVEISDREKEFSKVTDILTGIRDKFLASDDMSFEDAILEIQDELTKLAPAPKAKPEGVMPSIVPPVM